MNLSNLFYDPDAFEGQPFLFAVNQVLHAGLIGALPVLLGVPVWLALLIFAAWEIGQVWRASGAVYDGLEDFGFVLAGALVVFWWPSIFVALVFLAAGVARRFEDRE